MIQEFMIIFLVNYVGILISGILDLPVPGTIIGLILMFILLKTNALKIEKIENAVNFLLLNMTLFFMPPTVKIIDSYNFLEKDIFKVAFIIIISTFITMGVTGKIVQMMIDIQAKKGLK